MTITDAAPASGTARRLDQIGRGLLGLAAAATVGAFIEGCMVVANADDGRIWVDFWRTSAYVVFAGLFAMLALAPRTRWGLWELLFAQKVALVIFGVIVGGVNEAARATLVDLGLVIILVVSYVLCRGWNTWRPGTVATR